MANSSSQATPPSEGDIPLVKDWVALELLFLVMLSLVGGGLLLSRARADGVGSPPLPPFLLLLLAVFGLLQGQRQRSRGVTGPGPEPANHGGVLRPKWNQLGFRSPIAYIPGRPVLSYTASLALILLVLWQLPRLTEQDNYGPLFLAWLLAIMIYLATVAPLQPGRWQRWRLSLVQLWVERRRTLLLLSALVLTAGLLRIIQVGTIPYTLGGDEGSQGLEAIRVINRELRNPFSTGWLEVPTMSFFLNSLSIRLLGATNTALRLPWALVGTATVLITFFLVKQLTRQRLLALASAALLAVYHYHIHYSRLGSNQVADPFFVGLSLLFFYLALDRNKSLYWALTGLVGGLSLYFYTGARFTPVVIGVLLLYAFLREQHRYRQERFSGVVVMIVTFLLVGAPMLQLAWRFPDQFNARINQVGIIQSGWLTREIASTGRGPWEILLDQFLRSTLAFTYYPDRTVWYGLPEPLLDPFFGMLFLLGLGYSTLSLFVGKERQRLAPMVVWWWGSIILGGMLTESPPSTQRLITASVPACFFIAQAMWEIIRLAATAIRGVPHQALLAAGLVAFAAVSLHTYFVDFTPKRLYGGQNAEMATDLAPLLNELDETHITYFLGAPWMYWEFGTIGYMAPDMEGQDILDVLEAPPTADLLPPGRGGLFVILPPREEELGYIQQTFPDGELRQLRSETAGGRLMATLYIVPPR